MRHPSDITTTSSESGAQARPGPSRRAIARFLSRTRSTGRTRPQSIETDAKLQATHVRPTALRPELY